MEVKTRNILYSVEAKTKKKKNQKTNSIKCIVDTRYTKW